MASAVSRRRGPSAARHRDAALARGDVRFSVRSARRPSAPRRRPVFYETREARARGASSPRRRPNTTRATIAARSPPAREATPPRTRRRRRVRWRRRVVGEERRTWRRARRNRKGRDRRRDAERHAGRRHLDDRRDSLGASGSETFWNVWRCSSSSVSFSSFVWPAFARDLLRGARATRRVSFARSAGCVATDVELEEGHERRVRGGGGAPPERPRGNPSGRTERLGRREPRAKERASAIRRGDANTAARPVPRRRNRRWRPAIAARKPRRRRLTSAPAEERRHRRPAPSAITGRVSANLREPARRRALAARVAPGWNRASRSKNAAAGRVRRARDRLKKHEPSPFPSASAPAAARSRRARGALAAAARATRRNRAPPTRRREARRPRGCPPSAAAAFFAESIAAGAAPFVRLDTAFAAAAAAVAPADVPGRNAAHTRARPPRRDGGRRGEADAPRRARHSGGGGRGAPNAASIASDAARHTSHARDGVRRSSTSSARARAPARRRGGGVGGGGERVAGQRVRYARASVAAARHGRAVRVVPRRARGRRRRERLQTKTPILRGGRRRHRADARFCPFFRARGARAGGFRRGFAIRLRPIRRLIDDGERAEERVFHRLRGGEEVRERVDVRVYGTPRPRWSGDGATPLGELRGGGAIGGDGGGARGRERDGATRRKRRRARDARANRRRLRGRKSHGGVRGDASAATSATRAKFGRDAGSAFEKESRESQANPGSAGRRRRRRRDRRWRRRDRRRHPPSSPRSFSVVTDIFSVAPISSPSSTDILAPTRAERGATNPRGDILELARRDAHRAQRARRP